MVESRKDSSINLLITGNNAVALVEFAQLAHRKYCTSTVCFTMQTGPSHLILRVPDQHVADVAREVLYFGYSVEMKID